MRTERLKTRFITTCRSREKSRLSRKFLTKQDKLNSTFSFKYLSTILARFAAAEIRNHRGGRLA
jgi:hypothetical protein